MVVKESNQNKSYTLRYRWEDKSDDSNISISSFITIGSVLKNDIAYVDSKDKCISRVHLIIWVSNGNIVCLDSHSQNGTYEKGVKKTLFSYSLGQCFTLTLANRHNITFYS